MAPPVRVNADTPPCVSRARKPVLAVGLSFRLTLGVLGGALTIVGCGGASPQHESGSSVRRVPAASESSRTLCSRHLAARVACVNLGHVIARAVPPSFSGRKPIAFSSNARNLIIANAGEAHAFALTLSQRLEARVAPDSAAFLTYAKPTAAVPANRANARSWEAAGAPQVEPASVRRTRSALLSRGQYDFAPFGTTVTFGAVRRLGRSSSGIMNRLHSDLLAQFRQGVSAAQTLKEAGYLLAVAPLRPSSRLALLRGLQGLRGLAVCTGEQDVSTGLLHLCAEGIPTATELTLSTATGVVSRLTERLSKPSPLYPHLQPGAVVSDMTFRVDRSARHRSAHPNAG
jgi:hypothetical protein